MGIKILKQGKPGKQSKSKEKLVLSNLMTSLNGSKQELRRIEILIEEGMSEAGKLLSEKDVLSKEVEEAKKKAKTVITECKKKEAEAKTSLSLLISKHESDEKALNKSRENIKARISTVEIELEGLEGEKAIRENGIKAQDSLIADNNKEIEKQNKLIGKRKEEMLVLGQRIDSGELLLSRAEESLVKINKKIVLEERVQGEASNTTNEFKAKLIEAKDAFQSVSDDVKKEESKLKATIKKLEDGEVKVLEAKR